MNIFRFLAILFNLSKKCRLKPPATLHAPAGNPSAWELKSEQLLFQEIQGRHMGTNMAYILGNALDRYKLHGKV